MNLTEVITHPRLRQWLPDLVNLGMLLVLTASLAQWTWLLARPTLPPVVVEAPPAAASSDGFSLPSLLAANLFGQADAETVGRRLDNLPVSSLNLMLAGVIASAGGGYALISANGQPQEPYAVGETVTGGAVLHAVYPDRVVIRRHGRLESLLLEGTESSAPTPSGPAVTGPNPSPAPPTPAAQAPDVRQTAPNHYQVGRDRLSEQLRSPELLKQAMLTPSPGGGFLVQQIQPGSLYEKLGLRPGDVIKSVNGQAVNSAEDAVKLYQQLPTLGSVQMEILRGNRPESLYYQFAQN